MYHHCNGKHLVLSRAHVCLVVCDALLPQPPKQRPPVQILLHFGKGHLLPAPRTPPIDPRGAPRPPTDPRSRTNLKPPPLLPRGSVGVEAAARCRIVQMPFREEDSPQRRREAVKAEEAGGESFEAVGMGAVKADEEGGEGFEAGGIDGCEEEGCLEGEEAVKAEEEGGEEGCEDGGEEGCEEGGEEGCEGCEECCQEDMGDEELKIALRHSAASVILDELARHSGDGV